MKCKKLAAFGLVIALAASSSSVAFAATARAVSNMENTSVQQMDQVEETDTDILSDSEVVELQQEIASYSNDGILLTAAAPSTIGGVATTDIINAAKVMIRKYEGSYSSVNANDNGALSIERCSGMRIVRKAFCGLLFPEMLQVHRRSLAMHYTTRFSVMEAGANVS